MERIKREKHVKLTVGPFLKAFLTTLLILSMIALGFFGAQYFAELYNL